MSKERSYMVKLQVPFHDLDPIGIVWHGNYLKYFDIARFGLFRDAGVDLFDYSKEKGCLFPIIRTSTKHIVPLVYGDEFICKAIVREAEIKIVLDFEIRRLSDEVICVKGRGEQVAVLLPNMETLYEIPADIRAALGF